MNNKNGISLIVLIVTIIVVIILAAVVILTLSKNNPIESAKEARFKEDIRTFQDELALYISKQYANAGGHWDGNISATSHDDIVQYIPSFTKKYEGKFVINNNNLEYTNKLEEKEKKYAQNLEMKERPKIIPDEYQQVEYIESTGTQYIDTGIIPNRNTKLEIEGSFNYGATDSTSIAGTVKNIDKPKSYFGPAAILNSSSQILQCSLYFYYNSYHKIGTVLYGDRFNAIIESNNDKCIHTFYNKNSQKNYSNTVDSILDTDLSIYLFALHSTHVAIEKSYANIFYCNISKDNNDVRKFIPCYSKTAVTNIDGVQVPANTIGMYDTVEGKFYTNQGTGEFLKGPDVN